MKVKILILTIVLLFISSCGKEYKRPEIGMKYQDFVDLCGQSSNGQVGRKQDQNGSTLTVEMERNEKTDKNECYGTFTFTNGKLTKIGN